MADKTPLKFEFDSTTPSSLAEFTSSNTVPIVNGGTGTSSLTNFGVSLSSTNVSAASVSSTTISSPTFTGGVITGTSVSATALSGLTVNGVPYPAPFGYAQCDDAGTDSTNEQNFGLGATVTNIVSNSTEIKWNDDAANKYFEVSAAGTYELVANLVVDAGSQNDILTVTSKKNGSDVLAIAPRVYGNVGPEERTFHNILTAVAGDNLTISLEMGSTKTIHLEAGSTLTIKRIK